VLTAASGDTHHHFAISTGVLARYQPKPRCQMTAVLEVRSAFADCRYHCGSRLRPDSSDLRYSLTNIAGFEDRSNLPMDSFDAFIDLKHESVEARDDLSHHLRQLIVGFRQDLRDEPPRPCGRDRNRYPGIEQESAIWLINAVR
jgi:hypothetical protein